MADRPDTRVLVVGGGFAGVSAALSAARARDAYGAELSIGVINPDEWMTLRPRLYERDLAAARVLLPEILETPGVDLIRGQVRSIDTGTRAVELTSGGAYRSIPYDRLILAAGSRLRRPPVTASTRIHDVDTYQGALDMQARVRAVAGSSEPVEQRYRVTVVGAGLAGLETATELDGVLSDLAARAGHRHAARVTLIDPAPMLTDLIGERSANALAQALGQTGVELVLGRRVVAVDGVGVRLDDGSRIPARTVVWTGGLEAHPLAAAVSSAVDEDGRVRVDEHLYVPGDPAVLAAGDVAAAVVDVDRSTVMSCQYAIPMGRTAGWNAVASLVGAPLRSFQPPPYVTCVDLGAGGALFTTGWERKPEATGAAAKQIKAELISMIHPSSWNQPGAHHRIGSASAAP